MIEGMRLFLRPWQLRDAQALYELAKDEQVGPQAGWSPHKTIEESQQIIQTVLCNPETFAICLKQTNELIGSIGLMYRENSFLLPNEVEVGYWIGVPYWGCGYTPEALKAIQCYAFTQKDYQAIWGGYYDGNNQSKRVQQKCHMHYQTTEQLTSPVLGKHSIEHFTRITKSEWLKIAKK